MKIGHLGEQKQHAERNKKGEKQPEKEGARGQRIFESLKCPTTHLFP